MADYNPEDLKLKIRWGWETLGENSGEAVAMARDYMGFITRAKTERETVREVVAMAEKSGYTPLKDAGLKTGDRVYFVNRGRTVVLAHIGSKDPVEGFNIVGAHADAPRLDLKPQPLYEEESLALLKTHYYGGVKKYQWLAVPLALHGLVVTARGEVEVLIGENPDDPVFTIPDLLPHLSKDQMEKKISEAVTGEGLNALAGGQKLPGEGEERVKLKILQILFERYGIKEEDLISADLRLVPAAPARLVGLDSSLVGGYGQDDRICVYTALKAILELKDPPPRTALAVFCDKEEIGSVGNTGMDAAFFENTAAEIGNAINSGFRALDLRRALSRSAALSADVSCAFDPNFPEAYDKRNVARLGAGVVLTKYTGVRGKAGSSEATAEFVGKVKNLFNRRGITWQAGELGKVDQGGGGTIAFLLAKYGMDVLDMGPCLLGMHSPFEVASVVDIYETSRGYRAFLEEWA